MGSGIVEYKFLLLPIALGLMVPAATLPWITINFLGSHDYSAINILSGLTGSSVKQDSGGQFAISDLISAYDEAYYLAVFSQSAFVISIGMMGIAAWRHDKPWLVVVAGTLAISSALTWMYSVDSIKDNFAGQAAITGGIIGEEFKGHENALADALIKIGAGQYFVAAGGVTGLCYFLVNYKVVYKKTRISTSPF